MTSRALLSLALFHAAASIVSAQTSSSPPPRVAIEDSLSAPVDLAPFIAAERRLPIPIAVRLSVAVGDNSRALDERLSTYRSRKLPVWLAVTAPESLDQADSWRAALRGLLARSGENVVLLEVVLDGQDPKLAAFLVRLAATEARATRETISIGLGGTGIAQPDRRTAIYTADLAPYIDALALAAGSDLLWAEAHLRTVDSSARLMITGQDAGPNRETAVLRMLDSQLESLGTEKVMDAWKYSEHLEPALRALAPLARLMEGDVTPLDPRATGLRLALSDREVTGNVRHRLLFDNSTFATYLVYWSDPSADRLGVSLTLPVEGIPAVYRLTDGTKLEATAYTRNAETGHVRASVPVPGGPVLVDFNEGAVAVFVERSDVSAHRQLSVEEIIARHQQQQRAQDALVRSYIATARMQQHFRPTMTDPGYDVVTENRYYVADDGIEWEELSFSVNGSRWGADRPPFPLLQPEKVLSLPLQLRFDNDYRYRLAGTERVGEFDCYVVRFEPVARSTSTSFYRGTVWIERRTFARVKVQAVQTALSAPVVSNEEVQTYEPVAAIGNSPIFLFTGLNARQIMMIAGRNLLVEKKVSFGDFQLNPQDFEQSRTEARRSDRVMYRETDRGLRYFVKDGEQRVVSERATRSARAMAMGLTLDPSYAFPLPIFGINYLNFEFKGPENQLAVLFAGVLAAGNLQRPRVGSSPFDASVDFFAIAVPSSDRVYDAGGERRDERLMTWPLTTGANLGWQYTPFQKLTGSYQFRFDGYTRDTTTSETFSVPASTVTNGLGAAWEYKRGGYSAVLNGTWYARAAWRRWGPQGVPESEVPPSTYVKYSASLSRDFYFNVFHKIHLNAAWFGGRDLDRFGKYQFGMFDDTRIHGVPASGVRFGELGMVRGSYSFNIFEQYRLDLFLEQAWGRDRAFDDLWQPITGIGAAVNLRAPWNTILRADIGRSLLPDRYQGIGSTTLQVMFLKPLR
jgi:hypothetical protein